MTRRRQFLRGCGGVLLAIVARAGAQPAGKTYRIGYLNPGVAQDPSQAYAVLREALAGLGYVAGRNLRIEERFAEGKVDRLPQFAAELVALRVDLIVAVSPPAIRAARDATTTIPIVMAFSGDDPVKSGFVAELGRPKGNITGITSLTSTLAPKWIELIRDALPGTARIAVLRSPLRPDHTEQVEILERIASAQGLALHVVQAKGREDYAMAFDEMTHRGDQAVIILSGPEFAPNLDRLAELAKRHRLPSLWQFREFVAAGGLFSYGPAIRDLTAAAAIFVDKILKGADPGDLPVQQPTRFVLAINLATSKALGLKIPQSVLLRADEIVR